MNKHVIYNIPISDRTIIIRIFGKPEKIYVIQVYARIANKNEKEI